MRINKLKSFITALGIFLCITGYSGEPEDAFPLKDEYLKIFSASMLDDGSVVKHFPAEKGTIELWVKINFISDKDYVPLFFWGDRGWNNSVLLVFDPKTKLIYARISSDKWRGQVQFACRIAPDKWHHFALQWDTADGKIILDKTAFFVDGKPIADKTLFHNEKSSDPKNLLGGAMSAAVDRYFMLGAMNNNSGELYNKNKPDIGIGAFRVSSAPRYNDKFIPESILALDDSTTLQVISKDGKAIGTYKQPDGKTGDVEIEKESY